MGHHLNIKPGMQIIGADGVPVGTVDEISHHSIKLTKAASGVGHHAGHHHYLPIGLVAEIEGNQVRLSATATNAQTFMEEKSGDPVDMTE